MEKPFETEKLKLYQRFWFWAGLIAVLLIVTHLRGITRPFYGLHSWGEASIAWRAKVYFKYPISYTKLLSTWAVGDPPSPEKPQHYLDHPQLGLLMQGADMAVFGINEWAQRAGSIIRALVCVIFLMKIIKGLSDKPTALIAGFLYMIFPLGQYFSVWDWCDPLGFVATWFYLVVIGALKDEPAPKKRHTWGLGLSLFFIVQMSWTGYFYAMAIGIHYVCRCIRRKQWPDWILFTILAAAPNISLLLDFTVMAYGHNWEWGKIIQLYKWRSGSGELPFLTWPMWFGRFWEHAIDNFSLAVLVIAIAYLTAGQIFVLKNLSLDKAAKKQKVKNSVSRKFPQFWLILMPALFQLFLLKGTLWAHQYWERPIAPFVATAAALGMMILYDLMKKINKYAAYSAVAVLLAVCTVFCAIGTNYYFAVRWQQPAKIEMFKTLNKNMRLDEALLSFDDFIVNQNEVKGAFYRPEIAWYLDREIVQATSFEEIQKYAGENRFPYYIIQMESPYSKYTDQLVRSFRQAGDPVEKDQYMKLFETARKKEVQLWQDRLLKPLFQTYPLFMKVDGVPGEVITNGKYLKPDGKFLTAGMYTYLIFDLKGKNGESLNKPATAN